MHHEANVFHPIYQTTFSYLASKHNTKFCFYASFGFFFLLQMRLGNRCEGLFFTLKDVFNNPLYGQDLNAKRSRLKEEEDVWRLFLYLLKFCKKMFLAIFKLFPNRFRDATTSYFHPIEKHHCHQSVQKVMGTQYYMC